MQRRRHKVRGDGAGDRRQLRHRYDTTSANGRATPRRRPAPLVADRAALTAIAVLLAAVGGTWIASQPAATHSELDSLLSGSLDRWSLYLVPTLVGVWLVALLLDRARSPGPVITALALAASAVMAGTVAETLARFTFGHGDVLAVDGVLQRVIELVRVDVPTCAVVVIVLARRKASTASGFHSLRMRSDTDRRKADAVST